MDLPLMNLNARPKKGWAGLISDTSRIDVVTAVNDGAVSGSKATRAGTVVALSGLGENDNRTMDTVIAADGAIGKKVGAVVFSHSGTHGEFGQAVARNYYPANKPVNVMLDGRIWLLLKATTGVVADAPVSVAAPRTTAGQELSGWVEYAAVAENQLPGWSFTGRTETDDDGNLIAEVEINRQ